MKQASSHSSILGAYTGLYYLTLYFMLGRELVLRKPRLRARLGGQIWIAPPYSPHSLFSSSRISTLFATVMLLHAKSPLSFCCGAIVSLFLLYLWRISSFGFDIDPYLERKVAQTVTGSNESLSSVPNETITEPAVEKYSIQDAVSNTTLGVRAVIVPA